MYKFAFIGADDSITKREDTFVEDIKEFVDGEYATWQKVSFEYGSFRSQANRESFVKLIERHFAGDVYFYSDMQGSVTGKPINFSAIEILGRPIYGNAVIWFDDDKVRAATPMRIEVIPSREENKIE
jgi:hypothetical protein